MIKVKDPAKKTRLSGGFYEHPLMAEKFSTAKSKKGFYISGALAGFSLWLLVNTNGHLMQQLAISLLIVAMAVALHGGRSKAIKIKTLENLYQ